MSKFNNAKALAIGRGVTLLTSLLLLPYLSRSLPMEVYGSYGQVIFYIEIFKAFALLGLNKVVFIFLSKDDKIDEVYSNNIFGSFFAGLLLAVVCVCSSSFIAGVFDNLTIIIPICIYAITIPFDTCSLCYSSLLVNENKSTLISWIAIIANLLRAVILVCLIQYNKDLSLIFIGLSIASIVQLVVTIYFSQIFVQLSLVKSDVWKKQIKVGFPLGLTSILGTLYYLTDSMVVSAILPSQEYAILRNGAFQIPFISTLYSIIGLILMKDISDYIQQKDFKSIILLKSRAITLTIVVVFPITIFLIVFAKYWIPFLFSAAYSGSIIVFMIYNIMTLFRITDYESIIVLSEKGNKLPIIYLSSFIINIILSIPLTMKFGPSGSAMASIFSFMILIGLLTKINLNILSAKITDFIKSKTILKIIGSSLSFSIVPYLLIEKSLYSNIPFWGFFLLVISMLCLTYHVLIKSNIIAKQDLKSLFGIIPLPILQKFFIQQYCK